MGQKRTWQFKDSERFLKYREELVKKKNMGWEDSWATDKNWRKKTIDKIYVCKFCAKKMYAAHYEAGTITMSCRTPLCPGNIDRGMKLSFDASKMDIKQMTNQYLFDSRMRF
jgi:hypothetical protein